MSGCHQKKTWQQRFSRWLLEVNARPSMDISNPLRLSDAPSGTRRCVCRDMDGEEHCHVHSEALGGEDTGVAVDVVDVGSLRVKI